MENKIKVVFILPSLAPGGAQRVMSFIAQNLNKKKFETTLIIAGFEKDTSYNIEQTNSVYYNKKRVRYALLPIFNFIRKNKPHIVVSSIAHLNTAIALLSIFFPKTRFVGREANIMSVVNKFNKKEKKKGVLFFSIKYCYRFFDKIICQSKDMVQDMIDNFDVSPKKIILINNPITDDFISKSVSSNIPSEEKKYITVGSFKKQKGHLRILKLLSQVKHPFKYTMIGDGSEKDKIFNKINDLNLSDHITHIPFTKEVNKYLAESDYFLQGSYFEGFPNCLIESSAIGTPIIAFNAPGGLDEIIQHGENGLIANTEAEYLEYLNDKRQWKPRLVSNTVINKFSKEIIINKYEELFLSLST